MGRLFWKLFVAFQFAFLSAAFGVGLFLGMTHQRPEFAPESFNHPSVRESDPRFEHQPRLPDFPPPPSPLLPLVSGIIASLVFSVWLAWYLSRPVHELRRAFSALARGRWDTRIGRGMGGRRDEIADLGHNFDEMAGQLQQLVEAHQRLLHMVSHELRSPLARLNAAIGLLQQDSDGWEVNLARVQRESDRLDQLVSQFLTFSRLEAGICDENCWDQFDLAKILSELIHDSRFEAKTRAISIEFLTPESLMTFGNAELLHSAIENVIRNAIQYSPKDSVIRVTLERRGLGRGGWSLKVVDQGPGLPEDQQARVFEPFYRSFSCPRRDGSGLGLAITKRAMELHHGEITASNDIDGGLCISIIVPEGGVNSGPKPLHFDGKGI